MKKTPIFFSFLAALITFHPAQAASQQSAISSPELSVIRSGQAFTQFQNRPDSELSRLLYLVDRLGELDLEIRYGSQTYYSSLVAGLARWYIQRHYDNETAEEWLSKWGYRTIHSGEPVWVKPDNGPLQNAKSLIARELKYLEVLSLKA